MKVHELQAESYMLYQQLLEARQAHQLSLARRDADKPAAGSVSRDRKGPQGEAGRSRDKQHGV